MSSVPPSTKQNPTPPQVHGTQAAKAIGRPRLFDESQVLEAVLQVFWRHGYEGTTMAHLTKATGLHKGSLYQAFGDKKTLFIKVLKHYIDVSHKEMISAVSEISSPYQQLRELLHHAINFKANPAADNTNTLSSGCLAVNTMVERAPHDAEIQSVLAAGYERRMQTLSSIISAAQRSGELTSKLPATTIAAMIGTLISGLVVTLKGPINDEQAHHLVDNFLALLE